MIYTFRKELGKWKLVLWPVLISLAASSLMMIRRTSQTASIATVNGRKVAFKDFSSRMRVLQEQINQLRGYARSSGIPMETFLQLYGLSDPTQAALDSVIHEKLVEGVLSPLWVRLHEDVVSSELLKQLPADFVDANGRVNQQAYRQHLRQRNMHIAEFEDKQEERMYQELFDQFVGYAAYPARSIRVAAMEEKLTKKSFDVVTVAFDKVRSRLDDALSSEEKEAFYDNHKEEYRVPEKRDFSYWVVSPSVAERKVDVPEDVVERFYNRNKGSLYRVAPRVKVRHIFIKEKDGAQQLAHDLHKQISESPKSFVDLAKKHSDDGETAKKGGMRDFFSRGTYDKDFETAAFRLKKTDDLSPVVKTEAGYEIIQMVERIAAFEKSLSEVRDEVEKAVRGKRALDWLRTHLEQIRKDAGANKELVHEITKAAESHKTVKEALESQANSYEIEGLVVQHGYTLRGEGSYGFFMHDDTYVLVQLNKKTGSFIPAYSEVKKQVASDTLDEKATAEVAKIAEQARAALAAGNEPKEVARTYNVSLETSDKLSAQSSNEGPFKGVNGLLRKAFMLNSGDHVLLHATDRSAYLVKLQDVDADAAKEAADSASDMTHIASQLDAHSGSLSRAFVASLRQSAKIELNEKVLTVQPESAA